MDRHTASTEDGPTRRRLLQASGLAAAIGLAGCQMLLDGGEGGTPTPTSAPAETPQGTPSDRVESLLADLSLEGKAAQMSQFSIGSVATEELRSMLESGTPPGAVIVGGANPRYNDASRTAARLNAIQETATAAEAGIPVLAGIDAVHGNATVVQGAVFPHNIGMGATWNRSLARQRGAIGARSIRAMGYQWNFSPVADVAVDPRWGRYYEAFGESPHHAGQMAAAEVAGIESDEEGPGAGATVKHFGGYSAPENGNDRAAASLPLRELRESILPAYRDGIDAEASTVMVNSGSVNGVPAHASEWLLTTVLRERWGFQGVALGDWEDLTRLVRMHGAAATFEDAVDFAINAGLDMAMCVSRPVEFRDTLVGLVQDGSVPESRVDEAVRRILSYKESLGLLDDPMVDASVADGRAGIDADLEVARQAATESLTLLANNGDLLPLESPGSVLLTGPNADDARAQLGGWSLGWQGVQTDTLPPVTTVREAMADVAPGDTSVEHVATGHETLTSDDRDAVAGAAADADVAVAVLGEGPYAEGRGDVDTLALPAGQRDLVATVAETDTPIVGVFVAGRPRGSDALFQHLDATLMAYIPGSEGGPAIADALFGNADPTGRLPVTWPASTGQIEDTVRTRPPRNGPEPRFGFGTRGAYTDVDLTVTDVPSSVSAAGRGETVSVTVKGVNRSSMPTSRAVVASMARPTGTGELVAQPRTVVGFDRIHLEANAGDAIDVDLSLSELARATGDVPGDGPLVVPAGNYLLGVAGTQREIEITERTVLG